MAQVVVSFGQANVFGRAPVFCPSGVRTQELSTSGTHAPTTINASEGEACRIVNAGEGLIWVAVGVGATATVAGATCVPVLAGTVEWLGPCASGARASVIDDS